MRKSRCGFLLAQEKSTNRMYAMALNVFRIELHGIDLCPLSIESTEGLYSVKMKISTQYQVTNSSDYTLIQQIRFIYEAIVHIL